MEQTQGHLTSMTVWGLVGVVLPWLDNAYALLENIPHGVLPEEARLGIQLLGVVLAYAGRKRATKPLKGLVTK